MRGDTHAVDPDPEGRITGTRDAHVWNIASLIIGGFFLAYVMIRAIMLAITYDEAWTILDFVPNSLLDVLTCTPCDANNHLLNTLLVKMLFKSGITSLFMARLPNVIAFLIYLYFAWRIGRDHAQLRSIGMLLFFLLAANPFVLDFFSLSRGYGLALAFQLASIHQLLSYSLGRDRRSASLSMALAAIAALANLTFLNHVVATFAILALLAWNIGGSKRWSVIGVNVSIILLLAGILFIPIGRLLTIDAFYHGGETGIFSDTLLSLARHTTYDAYSASTVATALIFILAITAVMVLLSIRRWTFRSPVAIMAAMLVTSLLSIILQYHLLGTRYVIDRGALFLYPLFITVFCFALQDLHRYIKILMAPIAFIAAGINLFQHANTYKTVLWSFDAHTPAILEMLDRKGAAENRVIKVDWSWPMRSGIRYYFQHGDHTNLKAADQEPFLHISSMDAYILLGHSLENAPYDVRHEPVDPGRCDTLWSSVENVHVLTGLHWNHDRRSSPGGR